MDYNITRIEVDADEEEIFDITFFFEETDDEPFSLSEFGAGTSTRIHLARIMSAIADAHIAHQEQA